MILILVFIILEINVLWQDKDVCKYRRVNNSSSQMKHNLQFTMQRVSGSCIKGEIEVGEERYLVFNEEQGCV